MRQSAAILFALEGAGLTPSASRRVAGDTVCSDAEIAGLLPENVTVLDTLRLVGEAIALAHAGL